MEIEFINIRPANEAITKALADFQLGEGAVQPLGERGAILKFRSVNENTHEAMKRELEALAPLEEKRFESVGPTIGSELKKKSIKAIIYVLVLIIAYIAWAFRKVSLGGARGRRLVSSWKYGVIAVVALAHDVIIPTGVFSALGRFYGIEIDAYFVTAILTILGFSVHDTIVVFDRIRENLRRRPNEDFSANVNSSVNETLSRSINTSLTVLLVLAGIYFLGGATTQNFALALILGVFFGTYSSIFVASPLLALWASRKRG